MIGPELQKAIHDALVSGAVAAGRIYDNPPVGAAFPYVTIGDEQVIDDSNQCGEGWEIYPDIHAWSRPVAGSKAEVKALAASIVKAVTGITSVSGHALVALHHETTRYLRDPDGKTEHAVITFRAVLDPA